MARWMYILVYPAAALLLLVACGDGDGDDAAAPSTVASTATPPPATTTIPAPSTSVGPSTSASPGTSAPAPTTTPTPTVAPTTILAGEPIDLGPAAGDVIAVIGVRHDDVLNVRARPGIDQPIVATLDPLTDDVVAQGNARLLPRSIWYEVTVDGGAGWASSSFLAYRGGTDDITSRITDELGPQPWAETMADIGRRVAEAVASDDPQSRIRMSVAPSAGDLHEVTYDVVGVGDDATVGFRLHVFAAPDDETFFVRSIEQTEFCGRGVTTEGFCV